jgi:hypothetical protein
MKDKVWGPAADNCTRLIAKYNKDGADAAAKAKIAADKRNKEVSEACTQIAAFEQNPVGFCGDGQLADLADTTAVIASTIDATALANINGFQNVCDAYGSQSSNEHSKEGSSNAKTVKKEQFESFCKANKDLKACDRLYALLDKNWKNSESICQGSKDGNALEIDSPPFEKFFDTDGHGDDIKEIVDAKCTVAVDDKYPSTVEVKLGSSYSPVTMNCPKDGAILELGEDTKKSILSFYKKDIIKSLPEESEFKSLSGCDYDMNKDSSLRLAVSTVQTQMERKEMASHLSEYGGVSVAACNATNNNGVGKGLLPGVGQQRGLANQGALGFQL